MIDLEKFEMILDAYDPSCHKTVYVKGSMTSYFQSSFKEIRQLEGVSETEITRSICWKANGMALFKTNQKMTDGESSNDGGASSSFFFFTQNKKYLIKTMTKEEFRVMKKLLPGLL
jgi:hypothetical protein